MIAAIIILSILWAIQTVRGWWYRKLWRSTVKVNAALLEELDKAVVANYGLNVKLNGKAMGERYAKKVMDEWPAEIE